MCLRPPTICWNVICCIKCNEWMAIHCPFKMCCTRYETSSWTLEREIQYLCKLMCFILSYISVTSFKNVLHKIVRWWGKSKRAGGDQWWGRWCSIQLLILSFHFLAGITLHHDDADKLVQVSNGHVRKTARDISNSSWYTTHGLSSHHFLNQFGVQW